MRAQRDDFFAGILQELGAPKRPVRQARSVVGVDDASLVDAANQVAKAAPAAQPTTDYLSHLVAAHASQLADERAKSAAAVKDAHQAKSMVGWSVAGVLGAILLYVLTMRRK